MDELADIAASVAQALELEPFEGLTVSGWISGDDGPSLRADGSYIFDSYWQVRCRDWLLERGFFEFVEDDTATWHEQDSQKELTIDCPAAEFAARAIHALTRPAQPPA